MNKLFLTQGKSKHLLEMSKRAMESAIEKGEKAGMKVLEEQNG